MSLGAELAAAVDVLKCFARQAKDRHGSAEGQAPAPEVLARLESELAEMEVILMEIRVIRTELGRQLTCRPFISPWI